MANTQPVPAANLRAVAIQAAKKYGVDPNIFVRQISTEDASWDPKARSGAGAEGIAQFMPATARSYGIDPFNPVQALDAAARYDANELKAFHGDYRPALAAYNAGPGNADKWNDPNFAGGQTFSYVRKILAGGQPPQAAPVQHAVGTTLAASQQQPPVATGALAQVLRSNASLLGVEAPSALLSLLSAPHTGQAAPAAPQAQPFTPPTAVSPTPPGAVPSRGLVNPIANGAYERVDQGVDYLARAPVRALGSGTITSITKGMAGGTGDIIKEHLDKPVTVNGRTYQNLYYSEESPLVQQGQRVAAGQNVMAAGGNEIGFLNNQNQMTPLVGGLGAGTKPTGMGADFLALLRQIAAQGTAR